MKKFSVLFLLMMILSFSFVACFGGAGNRPSGSPGEEAENPDGDPLIGTKAFDTEDVTKVKVYWHGAPDGLEIPEEQLADMCAYLDKFRVGELAPQPIPPGTNTFTFTLAYEDGSTVSCGFDAKIFDGSVYWLDGPGFPDWLWELLTAVEAAE